MTDSFARNLPRPQVKPLSLPQALIPHGKRGAGNIFHLRSREGLRPSWQRVLLEPFALSSWAWEPGTCPTAWPPSHSYASPACQSVQRAVCLLPPKLSWNVSWCLHPYTLVDHMALAFLFLCHRCPRCRGPEDGGRLKQTSENGYHSLPLMLCAQRYFVSTHTVSTQTAPRSK